MQVPLNHPPLKKWGFSTTNQPDWGSPVYGHLQINCLWAIFDISKLSEGNHELGKVCLDTNWAKTTSTYDDLKVHLENDHQEEKNQGFTTEKGISCRP